MPIGQVEKEEMGAIIADVRGEKYNWFTCDLLRLIAKSDFPNRQLLRKAYPEEVRAYEDWFIRDFGDRTKSWLYRYYKVMEDK